MAPLAGAKAYPKARLRHMYMHQIISLHTPCVRAPDYMPNQLTGTITWPIGKPMHCAPGSRATRQGLTGVLGEGMPHRGASYVTDDHADKPTQIALTPVLIHPGKPPHLRLM